VADKVVNRPENLLNQGFLLENGAIVGCDGIGLQALLNAGRQWVQAHVEEINRINIFPVPDGDTGANILLTLNAALQAGVDEHAGQSAQIIAHGAMMGARGNSGVILSQILLGLAHGLAGRANFSPPDFAAALWWGVELAYGSVAEPVEGTMLTVVKAAAEAAAEPTTDLLLLWQRMVQAAAVAQANTPDLLPVLKEAGVTDSGGQGLVCLLTGGLRYLQGEPLTPQAVASQLAPIVAATEADYGYDVQFLLEGEALNLAELKAGLRPLGNSVVVVGHHTLAKIHLHCHDPGPPLSLAVRHGMVSGVAIENLQQQARAFIRQQTGRANGRMPEADGLVLAAVAPGPGLADIFRSLGVAHVIEAGPVDDWPVLLDRLGATSAIILPNRPLDMAAARQIELGKKGVRLAPTQTAPQGLAAALAFDRSAALEANLARMAQAVQQVRTLEIKPGQIPGQLLGLLDTQPVAAGQTSQEVVLALLAAVAPAPYEAAAIYFGRGGTQIEANTLAEIVMLRYHNLEIEIHYGGQPYPYIISLE
jgi:hypothetical protein